MRFTAGGLNTWGYKPESRYNLEVHTMLSKLTCMQDHLFPLPRVHPTRVAHDNPLKASTLKETVHGQYIQH